MVSGSNDQTIKIWDIESGFCIGTLEGHDSGIRSVKFSSDGATLISAGLDEKVFLWDFHTRELKHVLKINKPYKGMNITHINGLTDAEKSTLFSLGAVEALCNLVHTVNEE